jgi:cytochrome c-type biogenesis protein CcmE
MAVELVTSENRDQFNAKKMAERMGQKYEPEEVEKKLKKAKKKKTDEMTVKELLEHLEKKED